MKTETERETERKREREREREAGEKTGGGERSRKEADRGARERETVSI